MVLADGPAGLMFSVLVLMGRAPWAEPVPP